MTKIVGRESSPSNKISWTPSDGSLPMKHSQSGNRMAGTIALIIGSGWVYLFWNNIYESLVARQIFPDFLMMLFIALPGIFVILYGLSQYVYFEETTISRNDVFWRRRGLSGSRQWKEPISNYKGVLKEHIYQHGGAGQSRSGYTVYLIRLVHEHSGKDVLLYMSESSVSVTPSDWDRKWRQYAELFQLPVLEKVENGVSSSDVSDLDKPLIDKIRSGKLKVEHVNPLETKLGLMAKLERDDDLWIVTCYPVWNIWRSLAGLIIISLALSIIHAYKLISPQLFRYFLLFIPVCMIAIGFSMRKHITRPEQLALDKKSIYYRYRNKRNEWVTDDMPLRSIFSISVKSNPMHFRSAGDLVIEGKNRDIRFGWWLPRKTKLRLKNLLLSIIADISA